MGAMYDKSTMDAPIPVYTMDITVKAQAAAMHGEMQWLAQVIDTAMKLYWKQDCNYERIEDVPYPVIPNDTSAYGKTLLLHRFSFKERVVMALAMAPHAEPRLLDVFFIKNSDYERVFTEFGGIKGVNHTGFIPTGETVAFILAANNMEERFMLYHMLGEDHVFSRHRILKLVHPQQAEPFLSGVLTIDPVYLSLFTTGESRKPDYSSHFPAKLINTPREWDDLVLDKETKTEVEHILAWINHGPALMKDWDMARKVKPGFRSLFYGPPGTGKTLTASLLGKYTGLDVYKIDLSQIVSKYIGETEKNMSGIFDQAENKNWILFFDEGDALFGKRTSTTSSNDRYANQEVSYLLQRIEDYPGVIIVASNMKDNMGDAFSGRFQSMIYFPMPGAPQRRQLWRNTFSDKSVLEDAINLGEIAEKYEMAGGAIINVVRYCSLLALSRGSKVITLNDLMDGIRKEFGKEGKIV